AVVHPSASSHLIGVNPHPVAASQVSVVHALLSLHVIGVNTHPVAGSHVSVVHALLSLQLIGGLEQTPVVWLQVSGPVHALLSSQTGQRSRNPDWDPPATPPLVHVASFRPASYPTTSSIRLTVASSSCDSTVI